MDEMADFILPGIDKLGKETAGVLNLHSLPDAWGITRLISLNTSASRINWLRVITISKKIF
jgi:hypothetical protein